MELIKWVARFSVAITSGVASSRQCPCCGSHNVYAAFDIDGFRERAAAFVFRFPVECGDCGQRFLLSLLKGQLVLVLRKSHIVIITTGLLVILGTAFLAGLVLAKH